jgi:hypothetical protein
MVPFIAALSQQLALLVQPQLGKLVVPIVSGAALYVAVSGRCSGT